MIVRHIKYLGFKWRRKRNAPYLNDWHKLNRLIWCQNYRNNSFENHIFVDETTIRLFETPLYNWRYPSTYPHAFNNTSKFRQKLNIWGGISFKGATKLAVGFFFQGRYKICCRFFCKFFKFEKLNLKMCF